MPNSYRLICIDPLRFTFICAFVFWSNLLAAAQCNVAFVDGLTNSNISGKIKFEDSSQLLGNPDTVLATSTVENLGSAATCQTANCTASGFIVPALIGSYIGYSSGSELIIDGSTQTITANDYKLVKVESGGTLNMTSSFSSYHFQELKIEGNSTVNLTEGDYYFEQLIVEGASLLNVSGSGTARIYVKNVLKFESGSVVNGGSSGDPSKLFLFGYAVGVDIEGDAAIAGYIYSEGYVNIEGSNTAVFGAISAATVINLKAGATVTYDGSSLASIDFGSTCTVPAINHYEVVHDGTGLTCDSESVTIKACINNSCSTLSTDSVTLDFQVDGVTKSSPTFTGSTIFSFNHTVAETLTLSIANPTITPTNSLVCDDGSGNSCDMIFNNAGFRFLYGDSNSTILPNQIAGSVFGDTLKVQAVKDTNGVCIGLFTGNNDVDLSQENVSPSGTGGLNFTVNGSNIAKHSSVTSTTLNFGADSIATIPMPIYHDAGEIRLRADYDVGGISLAGSSNTFWVSPVELVISAKSGATTLNGATATAAPTYNAGESFDLTLSAYNSLGIITPNYSPGQIQLKLARTGPTLGGSVDGNLTYAAASTLATDASPVFQSVAISSFSSGVSTFNDAQYSEVGLLNLDVQDSNYGNVGIVIPSTAINIGRFIPDHFEQTIAEDGFFLATCNTGTTFAYSGQKDEATGSLGAISYLTNPILAITAYNKQGNIVQNYYEDSQGSVNDYMKLSASDVSITVPTLDQVATGVDTSLLSLTANMNTGTLSQNDLTTLPSVVALPKGVLHYQLSDDDNFFYNRTANALVAPFVSDIDFLTATIIDEDAVNVTATIDASPTGLEIRFGRLLLENNFGPETSNIPLPMQIEHFDGLSFVVTSNNNCVSYDASKISLTNISLDPALTNVLGGTGNFVAGKTQAIELEAPGSGNQGGIGVLYDIHDWLKYDWDNDGAYDNNPSAVATFGLFRGNDRIIYWREVF